MCVGSRPPGLCWQQATWLGSGLFALADRRHAGEPGVASHAEPLLGSVLLVQKGSTPRAAQGAWWEDDDCTECVGIRHWTAQDWALLDMGPWSGWALLRIVCVGRPPTCRRAWPRFPRGTPPRQCASGARRKHTDSCGETSLPSWRRSDGGRITRKLQLHDPGLEHSGRRFRR